jgi:signal transduction histidine kinase
VKRDRRFAHLDYERIEIGARAAALGLILAVSALTGTTRDLAVELTLLTFLAVAAVLPAYHRRWRRWRPPVEGLLASLVISTASPYDPSLLPYLVTPALSAGLVGGWSLAVITSGATIAGLLAPGALGLSSTIGSEFVVDAVQWSLLSLAVGLLAAWVRRVQTQEPDDAQSYAEATRLLTQLRDLALELSGGLDPVSLGSSLLDELRDGFQITRGWVFGLRRGGIPTPIAFGPGVDTGVSLDLDAGGLWRRVVASRTPTATPGPLGTDPSLRGAVLPICEGESVVGLIAVERRGQTWSTRELAEMQSVVNADAIRLDAAQLFDEVRTLATAEERQRLAREIHDGVAQEVASLGYLIDDVGAHSPDSVKPQLLRIREELSRIVSELRYSIFDLRREIGPGASLTSVLAEHARHVGETAGIAVHLELSESPARLRPAVESELLRIAQEAIANARRHSHAQNLWITCVVDAPDVYLRVEDDGRGLMPPREDSFGLTIMQERASRAGCTLSVGSRAGGGTSVEVRPRSPDRQQATPIDQRGVAT